MFEKLLDRNEVKELLKHGGVYHPYPDINERSRWDELRDRNKIISCGEEAFEGYPALTASMFLEFARTGNRKKYEFPYFLRRERLIKAILAECAENKGRFTDAVLDGIWCILEESSWVINAHNKGWLPGQEAQPLPDTEQPFVDLFAAQTAQILSYAVYLMGDRLDGIAKLICVRIERELEKRIFRPFIERDDFSWMGFDGSRLNNWTPWILSNVIESALLMCRDEDEKSIIIVRALGMLERYISGQPSDGGCDEGAGYWNFAAGSLYDCLDELYRATGGKIDVFGNPKIRAMAEFPLKAHVAGPYYWNFADCGPKPYMDGGVICGFGAATCNDSLIGLGREILDNSVMEYDGRQLNRTLNVLFRTLPEGSRAADTEFTALHELQVFAYRKGSFYSVIKGGNNEESHNHNDIGNFLIYADGEPQIVDLGSLVYTSKTFGPERYTIYNTRSANHNVPLLGEYEQQAGRQYRAELIKTDNTETVLNLSKAYPTEAGIKKLIRHFGANDKGTLVTDEIELEEEKTVAWVIMITGKIAHDSDNRMIRNDKIKIQYPENAEFSISEVPDTDGRQSTRFPRGLYRIALTCRVKPQTDTKFSIAISKF